MADRLSTLLPDNLKSRVSRLYVSRREFKNDDGKVVEYERGIVEILIKGDPFEIEFKLDKKDKALLALADVIDKPASSQTPTF
jgi:hypothetical protein